MWIGGLWMEGTEHGADTVQPCLVLGLKMGKWLKTRYLTIFPCTWDFVILGIGAYSTHQCIPEPFLKKIGRVLVNL